MKKRYTEYWYLLALLLVMLIAVHFYLESDVGIVVNFDDAFYAASIVNQVTYLKMIPWGAASFGFAALGR
ncbi:MAG: hypothetical protein ACP5RI_04085, partial [Candidatus Micrarchaeia archaeon]